MDGSEIFHDAMRQYGGRLDRRAIETTPAWTWYHEIEQLAVGLISDARRRIPEIPPVHFDFVHRGEPNAYAFKRRGCYFIGLTTGIRYLVDIVFLRMFADARIFPNVGDSAGEQDEVPPIQGYVPNADVMHELMPAPVQPRTSSRMSLATHMRLQAIQFLVGHELAHISLGHVDYWDKAHGAAMIAELEWSGVGASAILERQTLEWQADTRAVASGMGTLKLNWEMQGRPIPPWADGGEPPGILILHWAFAVNSLFRLMGDGRFSPESLTNESYPPLSVRRAMATVVAYAFVGEKWTDVPKEVALRALHGAAQYTEVVFAAMLKDDTSVGGLIEASAPVARDHAKRLMQFWGNELKGKLERFAYEREPEAPSTQPQ